MSESSFIVTSGIKNSFSRQTFSKPNFSQGLFFINTLPWYGGGTGSQEPHEGQGADSWGCPQQEPSLLQGGHGKALQQAHGAHISKCVKHVFGQRAGYKPAPKGSLML